MKKISCASCGKRYDCDADGFCPGAGPSISCRGRRRAAAREETGISAEGEARSTRAKESHSAAKRGDCFWDWKWCQIWQWTWWEMPFLTCSPDRLCRAPNGI